MKPISFSSSYLLGAFLCSTALLTDSAMGAQVAYDIHLNTSALIGHPLGPFYLDFQLNDGSGVGNGNNTATVSLFDFHGGGALSGTSSFGGVTGNLSTAVTLTDTSFINEFFQAFTPGGSLDFRLSLTTFVDAPTPDLFAFLILDKNLASLPTLAPSDAFFSALIIGQHPAVQSFGSNPAGGGPAIGAPSFVTVPESGNAWLLAGLSLAAVGLWKRAVRRLGRDADVGRGLEKLSGVR